MENIITLKKSGIYINKYNDNLELWEEVPINKPFVYYLGNIVKLENEFIIEDFMNILNSHKKDINYVFQGSMGGHDLDGFITQMKLPPTKDIRSDLMEVIIDWNCEVFDYKNTREISSYISYSAYETGNKEGISHSLGFSQLNNWKHLLLKIDDGVEYIETILPKVYEVEKKIETKTLLKGVKDLTLYDLLDGFLYELTYYGTPDGIYEISDEINEIEINRDEIVLDEYYMDRWLLESKEEELKEMIDEERYDEKEILEELHKEINFLKDKIKQNKTNKGRKI